MCHTAMFRLKTLTALAGLVLVASTPLAGDPAAFTMIVLPDTQVYTETDEGAAIFRKQTNWIVANRSALNIRFVMHEGDVVETASSEAQYVRARAAMSVLDQAAPAVPYGVLPGNHDSVFDSKSQFTRFFGPNSGVNFGVTSFQAYPWWGGSYMPNQRHVGNYQVYSVPNAGDFVVVHLAWIPNIDTHQGITTLADQTGDSGEVLRTKAMLRWADGVLKANANKRAILVFHAFLSLRNGVAERMVGGNPLAGTEFIWQTLIVPNPNVFLTLNGHELGLQAEANRSDFAGGRWVHQVLANYQSRAAGGSGWLRILTYEPTDRRIRVRTYSPHLNQYEQDANSEFTLPLDGSATTPPVLAAPRNLRIGG